MKKSAVIICLLALIFGGCSSKFFLMDTTSDSVFEYKNDYFVSKLGENIELHYEFWSRDGALWLSALNTSENLMFLAVDSSYITYQGQKRYFDCLVDWNDYSTKLSTIPNLSDYDLNRVLPVVPGQWKGLLGDPFKFSIKEWEEYDPLTTWTKEDSPWKIDVQICFYVGGNAFTPLCQKDEIWVESFTPVDARTLRGLQLDPKYKRADKFYITNTLGWDGI